MDDSEDVTCLLALLVAKNGFKDCDPAYQGAACYSEYSALVMPAGRAEATCQCSQCAHAWSGVGWGTTCCGC